MVKMNRDEIAKNINANLKNIGREIQTDYLLDYQEGQEIVTQHNESWSDGGEFWVETTRPYTYVFRCINECPVHIVDYDNEDETYELGAEGCEKEKEVLVQEGTKFRVTYVAPAPDMDEIGFITIEVEYVK